MTWQPISSAPKDGTRILIMCARPLIARWEPDIDAPAEDYEGPGWLVYECEDPWFSVWAKPDIPTHWMPLPNPPA